MSRLVIMYYSGTGNTRRALGLVATGLAATGRVPSWHAIEAGAAPPIIEAGDLLLVGFPAIGFSAPSLVIKALRRLRRLDGVEAALLCACGSMMTAKGPLAGWCGAALHETAAILRGRGALVRGSAEASYPENWTQMSNPPTGRDQEALIVLGDAQASAFASLLAAGGGAFVRRNLATRSLGRVLAPFFRLLPRRVLVRLFKADSSCSSCGLCARSCPAAAIVMVRGLPSWKTSCTVCNRCINLCPSRSIQTSTARLALFVLLNLLAAILLLPFGRLLAFLAGGLPPPAAILLGIFAYVVFTILQIGPLDFLLRLIERIPAFRVLFSRSFTRGFRRYLAPGFKPAARGSEESREI